MSDSVLNNLDQPVGISLPTWKFPPLPTGKPLRHRLCRLEPLSIEKHAAQLFDAFSAEPDERNWTYLPYGPFPTRADFDAFLTRTALGDDPLFYAILDPHTGQAIGQAAYLRITPDAGSIEIGHVRFSSRLQRTPIATAAMYLMMDHAFSLGYRRYEWKCDALNEPSYQAALRLGFTFEGVFRQATVYRGRNRDTAWFSIIDSEWPRIKAGYERWLAPENFDAAGKQKRRLNDCITAA